MDSIKEFAIFRYSLKKICYISKRFWDNFGQFRTISDNFGQLRTNSDNFGTISDNFGKILTISGRFRAILDHFGQFRKISDKLEHFRIGLGQFHHFVSENGAYSGQFYDLNATNEVLPREIIFVSFNCLKSSINS